MPITQISTLNNFRTANKCFKQEACFLIMAFERLRVVVDRKLANIGLKFDYKLWRLEKGESWASRSHIVHINAEDKYSTMMGGQCLRHILLHEIGHLFIHDYITPEVKKSPEFIALFGDLTKFYRRNMKRKFEDADFISHYAQVHPEDNFCEVFACCCRFEGNLKEIFKHLEERRKSGKVKKQILWISKFIKQLNV
jgi:hypothetical protein